MGSRPTGISLRASLYFLCLLAADAFTINSIEHRPTYGASDDPEYIGQPIDVRQHRLYTSGSDPLSDSSVSLSRYQYIGCFKADLSITTTVSQGFNADPNECLETCLEEFPSTPPSQILVAVHIERCACVIQTTGIQASGFAEAEQARCEEYNCKYYGNPLCGGRPDYWGVFREYDYQSLSTQGAYDPWRYVWYTIVAIREKNIQGGFGIEAGVMPERYYLHAVNVNDGLATFQYQMELNSYIVYGMQYDITSSRLVGLSCKQDTGRIRDDVDWTYKIVTIYINTTLTYRPTMVVQLSQNLGITMPKSLLYMGYSGASAILSMLDIYIFTQVNGGDEPKKEWRDQVYFVRIDDAFIMREESVDFKIENIYANEKYGDISAMGPRFDIIEQKNYQAYIYLGRVYYQQYSDTEQATQVDWRFNPINPIKLASDEQVGDFQIYPGVATSEHLFNKTAIAYRFYPEDVALASFTIYEVNIRTNPETLQGFRNWCNDAETGDGICQGSMDYAIPYAGIYNREPGIPLSLKSPSMISARFTIEALTIDVNFDRNTLKGALQIDEDNDYIPDYVNDSYVPLGPFDCGEVFTEDSVVLIGPFNAEDPVDPFSSSCLWTSDTRVQITLPRTLNITIGDSLYLKEDTIYAIPLGYPNNPTEWSPAATGGVQVESPLDVVPPVAVVTGSTQIDECAPIKLKVQPEKVGKWQELDWWMVPATEEAPNPKDLTNNPFRVYTPSKLQLLQDMLNESTYLNNLTLKIPSSLLEAASTYTVMLRVYSRWGLNSTKELKLTKLSFSAPSVFIEGANPMDKKTTDRITLHASGTPSQCADESTVLAYRWIATSGNFMFEDFPEIPQSPSGTPIGGSLSLNPYSLLPPLDGAEYIEYNFTVECYVDTVMGNVPEKTATDSKTIKVFRSPIDVVFSAESRMLTRGYILVLDARGTQDPDFPTPVGQTFRGTFLWKCLSPGRTACFGGPSTGELEGIDVCRQDVGTKFVDGGNTFYVPLFDDLVYCQYARGVMMFKTTDFEIGEYKFTVVAESYDGRQDELSVYIEVTDVAVPRIVLKIKKPTLSSGAPMEKYPITKEIMIEGTEEGVKVNGTRNYTWEVLLYQMNPAYNRELAAEQDPENPYTVDEFIFKDVSTKFDTTNAEDFVSTPLAPDLTVLKNVLTEAQVFRFRLLVAVGEAVGYSDLTIETAGMAPQKGSLQVEPRNATMDTARLIFAPDWSATDLPLSYTFGYYKKNSGSGEVVKNAFSSDAKPVQDLERPNLPLGEVSTNYTLLIYVVIATPFQAETEKQLTVQSLPPENATQALADAAQAARDADGSEVLNALDTMLSIDPTDPTVQDEVLALLVGTSDDVPKLPAEQQKAASLLNDMVGSGKVDDGVMDALENLVIDAASSGSFMDSEAGPELGGIMFSAMGGLMPGGDNPAFGASTSMSRHKSLNPDFNVNTAAMGMSVHPQSLMGQANRRAHNHPIPFEGSNVVQKCPSSFCDMPGLYCVQKEKERSLVHTCCSAYNGKTLCNQPPCWFKGLACPLWQTSDAAPAGVQQGRRLLDDRLRQRQEERQKARASSGAKALPGARGEKKKSRQEMSRSESVWFEDWKGVNAPGQNFSLHEVSDWDRTSAFYGWHEDVYNRRLQYARINMSQSGAEQIVALEKDEMPMLLQARQAVKEAEYHGMDSVAEEATTEMGFYSMSERMSERLRAESVNSQVAAASFTFELARNNSQRITRLNVMRDTIAKQLIINLGRSEVLPFPTSSFMLYIGKTTNMSNIHPAFTFPAMYQVPPDSPDNPTPDNNITGFAFEFVEYSQNIYSWAPSNPLGSNESKLVTLIVMKANSQDFLDRKAPLPIRVYADMELYSSVQCLYWDRFTRNTAGGAWSSEGIMNDGRGCITTHLSDIGIFVDGIVPLATEVIDDAARWEREIWESECIACGDSMNFVVVAVLGMVLFTNMLLIMLGYVVDETRRSDPNAKGSRYHFDGDGLTGAMNLDDPIAYKMAGENPMPLIIGTFINVMKREHAIVSAIFYNENFTRPQRLQCFLALNSGILALNSAVHSNPGHYQDKREWFIPGVISGLMLFPVYNCFVIMFQVRPRPIKKKLIKRSTSTKEVDLIRSQRDKLAHQTAMLPAPGYAKGLPPPERFVPGGTTVLNMPAPLPLPPLPGAAIGGRMGVTGLNALPPMPPNVPGAYATGVNAMGGQLALPALPGMTASMPLPPPPRYPPPPKGAQLVRPQTRMPPLEFPKVGPPPNPFLSLPPPPAPADNGMGNTNKALMGAFDTMAGNRSMAGETGATPLALPSSGHRTPQPIDNASTGGGSDRAPTGAPLAIAPGGSGRPSESEAYPAPPGTLADDARHGAADDSGSDMPKPSGPPSGALTPPGGPSTPTGGGGPSTPTGGGFGGTTPLSGRSRGGSHPVSERGGSHLPIDDRGAGVGTFSPASTSRGGGILRLPPAPSQLVPQGDGPMPLFIRAQPPSDLKAPFAPTPIGPTGLPFGPGAKAQHPWNVPPVPSAKGVGPPSMPMPPLVPPPPPPPPREEDQAFVRRIRYAYYDKVTQEHEKWDLLEDQEELGVSTPGWVYDTMTFMPYLACCTFTLVSIFVVLAYGVKFNRTQENFWIMGSITGSGVVLSLLELLRVVMITLVELRKFENRKKSKAGAFLPRRVHSEGDKRQLAPPPRLLRNATARPSVPDSAKVAGPALLPKAIRGAGVPPVAPPAPPPPPKNFAFSSTAMDLGGQRGPPGVPALQMPPGGRPPPGGLSGFDSPHDVGRAGTRTPPGGRSLSRPGSGTATPLGESMQRPAIPHLAEQTHSQMPPGSLTPNSGQHSLHSLNQSMNMQVKAGASRHKTPPPPPGRSQGQSPARSGGLPPPPPADRPPSYSRPSSAGSGAAMRRPPPPPMR